LKSTAATKATNEASEREEPEPAEEVDGLGGVADEELHHEEVEDDLAGAAEAVLGLARAAAPVVDHQLGHLGAVPARVDGDEAVHLAVELDVLDAPRGGRP
jgi:hypothetical protein